MDIIQLETEINKILKNDEKHISKTVDYILASAIKGQLGSDRILNSIFKV